MEQNKKNGQQPTRSTPHYKGAFKTIIIHWLLYALKPKGHTGTKLSVYLFNIISIIKQLVSEDYQDLIRRELYMLII